MATRTKSRGAAGRSKATPKKTKRITYRARTVQALRTSRDRIRERFTRQSDDVWGIGLVVLAAVWLLGRRWRRRQAAAREQRRLDDDQRSGHLGRPMPTPYPATPPPVAADRVPDVASPQEQAEDTKVEGSDDDGEA